MSKLKISSLNKKQFAEVANMKPVAPKKKGTFKQEMVKSINNIQKPITFGQNPNSISNKIGQLLSLKDDKTGQGYSITPITTAKQAAINYAGGKVAGKLLGAVAKTPAAKKVGEYLTTKTPLKNTYKLNPFAKKPDPNKFYRTLGDEGLKDALKVKKLRANPLGDGTQSVNNINLSRPSDVPYFAKGEIGNYPGNNIVAETSKTLFKRGDINPVTKLPIKGRHWGYRNIDETGKAADLPLEEVKLLKKDWLKGYKEIPKMKKGSKKLKYKTGVQQVYLDSPDYNKAYDKRAKSEAQSQVVNGVVSQGADMFAPGLGTALQTTNAISTSATKNSKGLYKNKFAETMDGTLNPLATVNKLVSGDFAGAAKGTLIGRGLEGLGVNFGKSANDRLSEEYKNAEKKAYLDNANKKFTEGSSTDAQSFLAKKGKYKVKARVIETEGREPIFSPKKADGTRDLLYYNPNDPTHSQGGVKMAVTKKNCGAKNMKYGDGTKKLKAPIETTDKRKVQAYNDSLNLYKINSSNDLFLSKLKKLPKGLKYNSKSWSGEVGAKDMPKTLQEKGANWAIDEIQYSIPIPKNFLETSSRVGNKIKPVKHHTFVYKTSDNDQKSVGFSYYKKPEQPYVLKKKDTYETWRSKLPKNLQYEGDYDLKGFYKENPNFSAKEGEHLTDKFKLPNHPTFSNESKYYREGMKAGRWEGDKYIPIPAIEKMSTKTPSTNFNTPLPENKPVLTNNTTTKKLPGGTGKFAQYPNMKKQLRYKQSASRMVNAKPVNNIVNTFAKGTKSIKGAIPEGSSIYEVDKEYDLSEQEIKNLEQQGYKLEY